MGQVKLCCVRLRRKVRSSGVVVGRELGGSVSLSSVLVGRNKPRGFRWVEKCCSGKTTRKCHGVNQSCVVLGLV